MSETRIAKLFKNGGSQAVRLPAEFRFEGDEVYVIRDDVTGDILLSGRPGVKAWADFFGLVHAVGPSDDFMVDRPMNTPSAAQGVFDASPGKRTARRTR